MRAVALPLMAQGLAAGIQVYAIFEPVGKSERIVTLAALAVASVQIILSRPRAPKVEATAAVIERAEGLDGHEEPEAGVRTSPRVPGRSGRRDYRRWLSGRPVPGASTAAVSPGWPARPLLSELSVYSTVP